MRQSLVNSRLVGPDTKKTLSDIMTIAMADLIKHIKSVLQNLKVNFWFSNCHITSPFLTVVP